VGLEMRKFSIFIGLILMASAMFMLRVTLAGSIERASTDGIIEYVIKFVDWLFTFDVPAISFVWFAGLIFAGIGLKPVFKKGESQSSQPDVFE
jgi:bacteriorhodopsin